MLLTVLNVLLFVLLMLMLHLLSLLNPENDTEKCPLTKMLPFFSTLQSEIILVLKRDAVILDSL
jgi:hypothetical protein